MSDQRALTTADHGTLHGHRGPHDHVGPQPVGAPKPTTFAPGQLSRWSELPRGLVEAAVVSARAGGQIQIQPVAGEVAKR